MYSYCLCIGVPYGMWSQFFLSGYDATYVCKNCRYLLHMAIFCIGSFTFHILNLELVLTANSGLSSLVFAGGVPWQFQILANQEGQIMQTTLLLAPPDF